MEVSPEQNGEVLAQLPASLESLTVNIAEGNFPVRITSASHSDVARRSSQSKGWLAVPRSRNVGILISDLVDPSATSPHRAPYAGPFLQSWRDLL